jgi:hypothetical protein
MGQNICGTVRTLKKNEEANKQRNEAEDNITEDR